MRGEAGAELQDRPKGEEMRVCFSAVDGASRDAAGSALLCGCGRAVQE